MKNKYTILLIILCLICGFTYILDVNYKNTNNNFNIEASKIDKSINLTENKTLKEEIAKEETTKEETEKEEIIKEETAKEETAQNLININTANKETLKSLPGIGDSLAENIIYYRENVSLFNDISDIKNVNRIGDKTYEKIKNLITVN